jgi:hypothetical protein
MRKTAIALVTLGLAAVIAGPALAVNLLTDSFTYPVGNLVPNGGWANFSGAVTDIQVTATGRAVGSGPNANDDHRLFAVQSLTTKTYACFEVIIPAVAAAPKPIYFAMLKDAGTSTFLSRVYVLPLAGGGWTFGISHTSTSATVGVTPWTVPLSYDTPYNIVINYDPVAKSSTLWVNPATEASPSVTDVNAGATAVAIQGFGLRQSATASTLPAVPAYVGTADWGYSVDNLGVGQSFDDACGTVTRATEGTWGRLKAIYR